MPAASSTPRSTRPRAACTASASRWSTRSRSGSRSRSRAAASSIGRCSSAAFPRAASKKLGRTPNRRGTKVRFKPDAQIFGGKAKFNPQRLFKMARAKAYLFGGVEIRWHCDKELLHGIEGVPEEERFHFPDGLKDYLARRRDRAEPRPSRHLHRQVGPAGRQRRGRMGGRLGRRRRRLHLLLLQYHSDRRRRHP